MTEHDEIWKDIEGYEGLYQVSSTGRVRSLSYRGNGKPQILKLCENSKGYLRARLNKDKETGRYFVHRLVAKAFLTPVDGKDCVDHIDGNPHNNNVVNLRFCTHRENVNFPLAKQRAIEHNRFRNPDELERHRITMNKPEVRAKISGKNHYRATPVLQFSLTGEFIRRWDTLSDAAYSTGTVIANIWKCLKGIRSKAGGFIWRYA